ncbi:MAG TPA: pitrilysin family protein [Gemmatimonadaceae bacterium]|nr:pitrilysin family protein [Gemmatimonadaceae bacterium]
MSTTMRPAAAPPRPYHFPAFERVTIPGGLRVVVAPVHKLPVVTVMLVTSAGSSAEPEGKDGVANLTARALLEGTSRRDGNELAERFERLGGALVAGADWDSATVATTVLSSRLREAVALLGEVVLEPAFPEREVERLRAERLADLLQLRTEPRGLANEMFARFTYSPASRYARPEDGGEESVSALGRADVEAFHRERYRPDAATLVFVGDVSVADATSIAREVFGTWRGSAPSAPIPDATPAHTAPATHIVRKEEAPQSELRIGHPGLPRSHPDYFKVLVMNSVLGGLFSSRINLNLREQHAYTYGAFSGFEWRRGAGPFVVSTAVRSDVTADAAREVLMEIERMRADAISADELTLATSYLDGVFPIKYETTEAIARALAAMVVYELPDDYFDRYRERIRAVTTMDVLHAASRYLHPEIMQLVVVGDPAAVRAPLEALAVGPVHVYDADGRPIAG